MISIPDVFADDDEEEDLLIIGAMFWKRGRDNLLVQIMMEIMIVPSKMMMTVLCVDFGDRGDFGDQRHH